MESHLLPPGRRPAPGILFAMTLLLSFNNGVFGAQELILDVPFESALFHPTANTASAAAFMSLRFLNNSAQPTNPDTGNPLTVEEIFAEGEARAGAGNPFDEIVMSHVMNKFEVHPNYHYELVSRPDIMGVSGDVGFWMNRPIPNIGSLQTMGPALIPINGSFDNWVAVVGTKSDINPFVNPTTAIMQGLWIKDPSEFPPGDEVFYTLDNSDPTAPHLDTLYLPIDAKFYAVVPTSPFVVPVPSAFATFLIASPVLFQCRVRAARR